MTESQFQLKLRRALQARLPKAVILVMPWNGMATGTPDLAIVHEGRTTWLELKVGHNDLSPIQRVVLDRMRGYAVKWNKELWTIYTTTSTREMGGGFPALIESLSNLCR